jgi:Transposase DDE domain
VLKGRRKRYALAVIRRVVGRVAKAVGKRRVLVTAARGFADVALFPFLSQLGITCISRVKASTPVYFQGKGHKWGPWRFRGNERHRSFGALPYCERCPPRLGVSKSRARDAKGHWGLWPVVSNRSYTAPAAVNAYSRRFGCEDGFRDTKGWLGCAKARMAQIKAWSRMFALFAMALLVMTSLGSKRILTQGQRICSVGWCPDVVVVVSWAW